MGRRIEKARDPKGALLRLLRYLRPYAWQLGAVMLMVTTATVLGLVAPYVLSIAIDNYIIPGDLSGLVRVVLLLGAIYLVIWAVEVGQGYIMVGVSQRALYTLRRDLFGHLQKLPLKFFDEQPHGELMSRLTNDIDAINHGISMTITQLLGGMLSLGGVLVAMFLMNVWLALSAQIILPLMLVFTALIGRRTREGFRQLQTELGELNGLMEETISGQKVVQAFRREPMVLAEFDRQNISLRNVGTKAMTYALLVPPMMGVLSNAGIAVVAGFGGWLALRDLVTVGTIAAFINYSRRFAQPLRQIADLYNTIQSALAGAERVFETMDEEPEPVDGDTAVRLDNAVGEVVFDRVDFRYVPDVPVLKDVSFKANVGQTVALVGPTGAGKTTIVNLLSRFYDIQDGTIWIDGHNICEVERTSLRRQLGVVLQDMFLFSGTVMENIRYGRLDATDEECIEAARLANADHFIRRLPNGYETMLSERGSNLSQGQRQLISIARAVLANPRILVLDEATSSVDTRTEVQIQEALLRLMEGRTAFVIAHRLSTIRNADHVLVINHGEIIERGTHDSLLAQKGFYYNLYMSQFRGTNGDGILTDGTDDMMTPGSIMLRSQSSSVPEESGGES